MRPEARPRVNNDDSAIEDQEEYNIKNKMTRNKLIKNNNPLPFPTSSEHFSPALEAESKTVRNGG